MKYIEKAAEIVGDMSLHGVALFLIIKDRAFLRPLHIDSLLPAALRRRILFLIGMADSPLL